MSATGAIDDSSVLRSVSSSIPLLDRHNWFQWEEEITPVLQARSLEKYIENNGAAPAIGAGGRLTVVNTANTANDLLRASVAPNDIAAVQKFDRETALTVVILRQSLSTGVKPMVMGYDKPWNMYWVIEQYCKPQPTAAWYELTNTYMRNEQMQADETVAVFGCRLVNRIRSHEETLGVNQTMPDESKSLLFFNALPNSGHWMKWKQVYRELNKTFAENYSAAILHELKMMNDTSMKNGGSNNDSSSSSSTALIYSANENKNNNNKREKKCWNCDKIGHIKSECHKLKREIEMKKKVAANANGNNGNKQKCGYCNKTNHTEDRCFKKQKDGASKEQMQLANGTASFDTWLMMHTDNNNASSAPQFYVDTGATRHLACDRSLLHDIRPLSAPITITVADGRSVNVIEEGVLHLNTSHGRRSLANVVLCESAGSNLSSVGALADTGATSTFTDTNGTICDKNGRVLFESDRVGRSLYAIRCSVVHPSVSSAPDKVLSLSEEDLSLWH